MGSEVLASLPEDKECLVILGRPYNTLDPSLNLSMIEKLINLDVLPIPLDFLPLEKEGITRDYNKMYWPNGQKILAAARLVAKDPRLHAIYMGNFRCGPDSFLSHFVHEEMAGKPYMELEIDDIGDGCCLHKDIEINRLMLIEQTAMEYCKAKTPTEALTILHKLKELLGINNKAQAGKE